MRFCVVCRRAVEHPTNVFCEPRCGRIWMGIVIDCDQERAMSTMAPRWSGATGIRTTEKSPVESFVETFGPAFTDLPKPGAT
jgi:hypothetical protein